MLDFIRIACAVPAVKVGDVEKNLQDIISYMDQADQQQADLLVLPELCLTGYSCGDLFHQDTLLSAARDGLLQLAEVTKSHPHLHVTLGVPVRLGSKLLNCAAVLHNGSILGLVPKTYLSGEESRWFVSGADLKETAAGLDLFAPNASHFSSLGTDLLFTLGDGAVLGIEICEDMNAPIPPSAMLATNGANVIVNLSASPDAVGKRASRCSLVQHLSRTCRCVYAYCSAGSTESTSDKVYSGHSIIAQSGKILAENDPKLDSGYMILQDCDLGSICADRRRDQTFQEAAGKYCSRQYLLEPFQSNASLRSDGSLFPLNKLPFIPSSKAARAQRCKELFQLQVTGLKQRLKTIGANAVIGISGGLDSTLALLVAVEAMRQLGRPMTDVYGITMPCFGTSDRTYRNAWELMRKLGIQAKEIPIRDAVRQHFLDIGHDESIHNGTYENSQARERTQILMDFSGSVGGIVVGTGDLSELALGWCTYNGDHMSMYSVNATVPKTLIRWVIAEIAELPEFIDAKDVLLDILDTPISPELLPPDAQGKIAQQTEDLVGPYALHDFFLYYMLRWGFTPTKIYTLACRAFQEDFSEDVIKKWLRVFYQRFFTQQFKRNCMPDGVSVGSISLGPRGDWRMPSDASGQLWLKEIDSL